jgi:ribonuclease HI
LPSYHKFLKIVTDASCHIPIAHMTCRSGKGHAYGGIIFLDADGSTVEEDSVALGELTVPQAEYRSLIHALDKASTICCGEIDVWLDSELVVRQLNGDYAVSSENMKPLYHEVKNLELRFAHVRYFHHRRSAILAKRADELAERERKKHES